MYQIGTEAYILFAITPCMAALHHLSSQSYLEVKF